MDKFLFIDINSFLVRKALSITRRHKVVHMMDGATKSAKQGALTIEARHEFLIRTNYQRSPSIPRVDEAESGSSVRH